MRQLITLIALAAIGYGGWQVWQKHPEYFAGLISTQKQTTAAITPAVDPSSASTAPESAQTSPADTTPQPSVVAVPTPEVKAPTSETIVEQRKKLPPGQFVMTERVSTETRDGVTAVVRGELVKLLERRRDGSLKVTNGKADFIVKPHQVTQDVVVSRQLESQSAEPRVSNLR